MGKESCWKKSCWKIQHDTHAMIFLLFMTNYSAQYFWEYLTDFEVSLVLGHVAQLIPIYNTLCAKMHETMNEKENIVSLV